MDAHGPNTLRIAHVSVKIQVEGAQLPKSSERATETRKVGRVTTRHGVFVVSVTEIEAQGLQCILQRL